MKYALLALICAVVFLVCFLVDKLIGLLFPKSKTEKSGNVVRLPRRNAVAGVLLVFVPLVVFLFFIPEGAASIPSIRTTSTSRTSSAVFQRNRSRSHSNSFRYRTSVHRDRP